MAGNGQTSRRWREVIRPTFYNQCATQQTKCWLCRQTIDYTITDIHDDDIWEPDHFYPRSTHPQLAEDPNNLRASHRGCNRQRSNKQHTELHGLGQLTRNWWG